MTDQDPQKVIITDVKMHFLSMVIFMVKWAIASIPALIIVFVIGSIFFGMFAAMFSGAG